MPGRPFHYVVFGLGQRCEAVGKTMANTPVHYSTESLLGPLERYAHLLVVYEIPGAGPARLAAVAALDGQEITGVQTHLNAYYK